LFPFSYISNAFMSKFIGHSSKQSFVSTTSFTRFGWATRCSISATYSLQRHLGMPSEIDQGTNCSSTSADQFRSQLWTYLANFRTM
jgi:hypothetical protein